MQLPRFQLECSYTLRDALKTLQVTNVFEGGAEINNLGEGGTKLDQVTPPPQRLCAEETSPTAEPRLTFDLLVFVVQVYQTSVLNVDETSAAAGGGATGFSSLPPRLTINRPFVFVVYHEATSSVLSMGRLVDPTRK